MKHILVVDDDRSLRTILCMVLEADGYSVEPAPDGMAALAYLREHREPCVVLLDYYLPRLDGYEVLCQINAEAESAMLPPYAITFMTAAHETLPLALVDLLHAQDIPLLAKPFGLNELLRAVAVACRRLAEMSAQLPAAARERDAVPVTRRRVGVK